MRGSTWRQRLSQQQTVDNQREARDSRGDDGYLPRGEQFEPAETGLVNFWRRKGQMGGLVSRRGGRPLHQLDFIPWNGDYVAFGQLLRPLLRRRAAVYKGAVAAQVLNADLAIAGNKGKMLTRDLRTVEINRTGNASSKNQPLREIAANGVGVRVAFLPDD